MLDESEWHVHAEDAHVDRVLGVAQVGLQLEERGRRVRVVALGAGARLASLQRTTRQLLVREEESRGEYTARRSVHWRSGGRRDRGCAVRRGGRRRGGRCSLGVLLLLLVGMEHLLDCVLDAVDEGREHVGRGERE